MSSKRLTSTTLIILTGALATALSVSLAVSARDRDEPSTLVYPPWKHTMGLNRVNQSHLDVYSGYRKKFSDPQGIAAVKLSFNDKQGTKDDDELTVYGVNSGAGEIIYNKSMTTLGFFGEDDMGRGGLRGAVGIAADREGNVFVADRPRDRVIQLVNENNALRFVRTFDLADTGLPLRKPSGVAVEGGRVYIADTENDRIAITDLSGRFVGDIKPPSPLTGPFAVAVIAEPSWNFYGSQFVVVTDSLHRRLSTFGLDGSPIASRRYEEVAGRAGGFFFLAVDYHSNIYVTDPAGGCIYKFGPDLRFITRFGCGTGSKRDLIEPRGITIYRRFGQVFVAEKSGASYFWVGTDVQNLTSTATSSAGGTTLEVRFVLTEQSEVAVRLTSADGKTTRTLAEPTFVPPGQQTWSYRIQSADIPCPVAICKYDVVVTARPTYASKDYHSVERKTSVRMR